MSMEGWLVKKAVRTASKMSWKKRWIKYVASDATPRRAPPICAGAVCQARSCEGDDWVVEQCDLQCWQS